MNESSSDLIRFNKKNIKKVISTSHRLLLNWPTTTCFLIKSWPYPNNHHRSWEAPPYRHLCRHVQRSSISFSYFLIRFQFSMLPFPFLLCLVNNVFFFVFFCFLFECLSLSLIVEINMRAMEFELFFCFSEKSNKERTKRRGRKNESDSILVLFNCFFFII